LVDFYSKSNRLSISIFTVIVIDIVVMPYLRFVERDEGRSRRRPLQVRASSFFLHSLQQKSEHNGERMVSRERSWSLMRACVGRWKIHLHTVVLVAPFLGAARTGSGPMWMYCDIFAAARLWRGCLLTTGRLSCHPVVVCTGRVGRVLLFILGSNLGGVRPERGLRGGGRRGWCEEWARSG
jgi:hypothetical protein